MPVAIQQTTEGWIIPIKVTPKSGQNAILPLQPGDEAIKVKVTAAPDKGQANEAVIAVLAKAFNLGKRSVQLVSGDTARQKRILLQTDWSAEACCTHLALATQTTPDQFICR